jgi:hypothetical protein
MKQKQQMQQTQPMQSPAVAENTPKLTDEQIISIFSTGEKVEKTPRVSKKTNTNGKNNNKNKK